ncbi:uncharacterized protein LOC120069590 [Benincasa hispida]|uniref:uncharacterized protein LOC120069590 n=1 Tax=Benincasa hispida TaxID=102211 RepID=UPI001900FF51|nr:uncharacterized protein LOC120069590 [Benincasa hispida]
MAPKRRTRETVREEMQAEREGSSQTAPAAPIPPVTQVDEKAIEARISEAVATALMGKLILELEAGHYVGGEYEQEFDKFSYFAPELVAIEVARTERFIQGLRSGLRGMVHALDLKTYVAVLRAVVRIDADSQGERNTGGHLGLGPPQDGNGREDRPICTTCSKQHCGRCLAGSGICFRCGQKGHMADRCPRRNVPEHRSQPPFALSISTPSGEIMLATEKIKACQVEVANRALDVTLIILDMHDFDVILGMDWLAANHANIDCSRKEVIFNPPTGASFKFKGVGTVVLLKVISILKASGLFDQGAWGFMASVVDTKENEVTLTSEPVVRDFPDVFPEDLPRLPPQREIDFAIELKPGTTPISRASYRMAPAELKELKV